MKINDIPPGVYLDMPYEQYAELRATHITSSALRHYEEDPVLLHVNSAEETSAMTIGTCVHSLLLEKKKNYFTGGPVNPKTGRTYGRDTQKFQSWLAEQAELNPGQIFVNEQETETIEECVRGAARNPLVVQLLDSGSPEVTVVTDIYDVPCAARIDWIIEDESNFVKIIDLKTTYDLEWFPQQIRKWGYHLQHEFYGRALRAHAQSAGQEIQVEHYNIAIETVEPYRAAAFYLSDRVMEDARIRVDGALRSLSRLRESREPVQSKYSKKIFVVE